jgi:hypothetical protein
VPGRYADYFHITDIVATLCAAMHISEPSGSIGKPFIKALAEQPENAGRVAAGAALKVAPRMIVAPGVKETPPAAATPKPRKK